MEGLSCFKNEYIIKNLPDYQKQRMIKKLQFDQISLFSFNNNHLGRKEKDKSQNFSIYKQVINNQLNKIKILSKLFQLKESKPLKKGLNPNQNSNSVPFFPFSTKGSYIFPLFKKSSKEIISSSMSPSRNYFSTNNNSGKEKNEINYDLKRTIKRCLHTIETPKIYFSKIKLHKCLSRIERKNKKEFSFFRNENHFPVIRRFKLNSNLSFL